MSAPFALAKLITTGEAVLVAAAAIQSMATNVHNDTTLRASIVKSVLVSNHSTRNKSDSDDNCSSFHLFLVGVAIAIVVAIFAVHSLSCLARFRLQHNVTECRDNTLPARQAGKSVRKIDRK